jgi:hypothetical protein
MTLIKFPGRHRPQPLPPRDELAALELELVRARLAQVRSEIHQANAFWVWFYFKKAVFWAILLWLMSILIGAAHAQTRSFYDAQGQFSGSSVERGNSRSFYDRQGSFAGSSVRIGNSRSFYDDQGRFVGSSTNNGPRQ